MIKKVGGKMKKKLAYCFTDLKCNREGQKKFKT